MLRLFRCIVARKTPSHNATWVASRTTVVMSATPRLVLLKKTDVHLFIIIKYLQTNSPQKVTPESTPISPNNEVACGVESGIRPTKGCRRLGLD